MLKNSHDGKKMAGTIIDSYFTDKSYVPFVTNGVSSEDNGDYLDFLREHEKYSDAYEDESTGISISAESPNQYTRHKCKAGLAWAVDKGKKVHFVLDDLDMKAIVNKSFQKPGVAPDKPEGPSRGAPQTEKHRSITGSELRWVFRNKDKQEVQDNIQFWFENQPCSPPWEDDQWKALWEGYQPRSQISPS